MEPLTPPDCDLRALPCMLLDVNRLRDSDLAALESPEACWAAVLLWCASWHQVPAASLPDDDRVLSNLAGYGRVIREWLRIKDGAMRGWVICSDSRLYHPVVAEKALESWAARLKYLYRKFYDRARKEGRGAESIPDFESWNSNGRPTEFPQKADGIPTEKAEFPTEKAEFPTEKAEFPKPNYRNSSGKVDQGVGIPAENAVKVNIKVKERKVKEGKPKAAAVAAFAPLEYLLDRGVDQNVAADWLAVRKAKKLPPTETAFAGVEREAAAAGLSLSDAVRVAVERGWGAFKAEWYANANANRPTSAGMQSPPLSAWERKMAARKAAGDALCGKAPTPKNERNENDISAEYKLIADDVDQPNF